MPQVVARREAGAGRTGAEVSAEQGSAGEKAQVLAKEAGGRMTSHKPLFFLA